LTPTPRKKHVHMYVPVTGFELFPDFKPETGRNGDTLALDVTNNLLVTVPQWKKLPLMGSCTNQVGYRVCPYRKI
jgi:hypothetical protein